MQKKSTAKQDGALHPQRGPHFPRMTGQIIGVMVLALGAGAFIGVGYLAYEKFYGGGISMPDRSNTARLASMTEAAEICPSCGSKPRPQAPAALPAQNQLFIPEEKGMRGLWQYDFGSGTALLQMGRGDFELIHISGAEGEMRKYVKGTYEYDQESGLLRLLPRHDLGPPESGGAIEYSVLTHRPYSVEVRAQKDGDFLFWQPHIAGTRHGQLHPIFIYTGTRDAQIRWQPR